ncbi:EAL domain-containing protein [Clostridium aminobutyricum]|uniref:EAL domain-containing protein n=1 Tax=Clostridium aminobutyricum TaxID=33953 RepID=A0A939DAQ9_CLOAM|nr:EAL domain-containing protein [Clostridium aminobutyricum]MBN7774362.1 EAL domain-containing protein [Clostridium aminobutyricum]
MKVKPVSRLYLTFEVDLDSMSVILIKDGKQGRTYEASQYFQYFVEYGVRKVDVEQLKEHFSISYFQNMLVKGKAPESFEFCVKFVGKDYKILECKMKVVENTSSNIIQINLEDISHKRLEQLAYIKEHSLELEYQPAAKPFDIKFEELSKKQRSSVNKIRGAVVAMLVVLTVFYAGYIYNIYSDEKEKTESDMLETCRIASQTVEQQLDYSAKDVTALEDVIINFGDTVTEKEALDYLQKSKAKYGYTAAALIDENLNLVASDKSLYHSLNVKELIQNSEEQKFVLLSGQGESTSRYLNYCIYSDKLRLSGKKYIGIMALYDLPTICNVLSMRGHYYDEEIVMSDLEGNILWDNKKVISDKIESNILSCLSKPVEGDDLGEKINTIKGNMQVGKSGIYKFTNGGERIYAAYTPLRVDGLYLFSWSSEKFLNAKNVHFIFQSLFLWILILLLPTLITIYVMKHTKKARINLEELAYRDNVTQGMNANYFDEMATNAIKAMECTYCLVLTNIVNFNIYNKKYGYMKGDEVIRRLFLGICKYIDEDELVCRTYADHMMILLKYVTEARTEDRLAEISKCLIGTNIKVEFGVCIIRDATMDLEVAKERANMALMSEKKRFSEYAAWAFYGLELVEKISFEKELENTMYKAFRGGEFKIYIEPRYNLENRALCGGDAYVVWKHPDKGILKPGLFMDIFERRGLVLCLDTYIFEEICKRIKMNLDQGRSVMPVCIKLHKSNFNYTNSIDKFKRIKNRYDIPGKFIEFEITEQIFYEKISNIEELVDCIHSMGCTCIMGNFGGGYLAVNMLQGMKVDGIKLDKSCMRQPMPEKMVCAMVEIGKAMGVKTIAAGILEETQVRYLKKCNCDEGTGSVFSKTISLGDYINIF